MSDLISVIVVSYNSADTIVETLDSIYNQTYKNIELILTDDNSKDNTVEVTKDWISKKGDRFSCWQIVTTEKNTGVSGNVDRGVRAARGKYYKDIAADDLLRPNAIEVFYEYAKKDVKVIYQGKIDSFYEENNQSKHEWGNERYNKQVLEFLNLDKSKQYTRLLYGCAINAPAVGLISVEAYKKVGGIDLKYSMVEDYPLWLRFAKNGYEFRLIDQVLADYRVSDSSISHGPSKVYTQNLCQIFEDLRSKQLLENHMYLKWAFRYIQYLQNKRILKKL